jgi:hypothetical protein
VIYRTATTLDGFIADSEDSLTWLFEVEHDDAVGEEYGRFLQTVTVYVEGSTTYEWVLREANLLTEPEKWQTYYGSRPTFVFTTRALPRPEGADVRFVSGPVAELLPEIRSAAAGGAVSPRLQPADVSARCRRQRQSGAGSPRRPWSADSRG